MTAPNEPIFAFGLRSARLYALNGSGTPAAADETAYEGLQIKGSVAFELTLPEPRKITGNGEDKVTVVVYLPPQEGVSSKLNVEADDPALDQIITGNLARVLGDSTLMLVASDNQGYEPNAALLLQQACRGLITGKQYWRSYILPSAMLVAQDGGMGAEKSVKSYNIAPNVVDAHLWGEAFSAANEGAESGQVVKIWSNNPVRVTSFVGDGATTTFAYPAAAPSPSTFAASTKVFVDGVLQTSGVTPSASGVAFATAPAAGKRIDVFRETAKA